MGTQTKIRQTQQIQPSKVYTDDLAAGSTLQSSSVDLETDLNAVRSQVNRMLDNAMAGKWYDDITAAGGVKRGLKQIGADLYDIEQKKLLFRTQILTDIAVPAQVKANGSLTAIVKGSLADGDKFTLNDGVHAATVFYFDVTGGYTPPGGVEIDISGTASANEVATAMRSAINGVGVTLDIAASGTNATVALDADNYGAQANRFILETVTATLTPVGMKDGAGNVVVLVEGDDEAPTEVAAVDTGTTNGAVVKDLAGLVGYAALDAITGFNAINPKNLLIIRDAATSDPVMDGTHEVFGLFQANAGVISGDNFDDSDHKCQISFVRENDTGDGLTYCAVSAVQTKTINYSYVLRTNLDAIPEQAFLTGAFVDQSASVDVTLNNAIDNQSGPATQVQSIEWRISDTYSLKWETSDGGRDLLAIIPNAAGDEIEINIDTLDINNTAAADFSKGITVDSADTGIHLGVTAGQIDRAGALTLLSTGAGNDLLVKSADELQLEDGFQAASGYDTPLVLSDSSAEWDAYETKFGGEVSLLNAIVQAANKGGHNKKQAVVNKSIDANDNVTGAGGSPNIDTQLFNYDLLDFMTDVNVYVNGVLMRNGADLDANNDVYPGTTKTNGDLKFEFKLHYSPGNPDVITMEIFHQE
jgi:hypothetical protein